ncbi:MAG: beta-galactosidase [Armatimonadetes bacterium]|nr:beta-galactosidase [Armatimonadota bacterium]
MNANNSGQEERVLEVFYYGVEFHRPPNPPRSERRKELQRIKNEFGFNIIRLYPGWAYYQPAPENCDLTELHEILDICDEIGLSAFPGLQIEEAPYWAGKMLPHALYVNARGEPYTLRSRCASQYGGWPGLCYDNEDARELAEHYMRQFVTELKDHPSVMGFDLWNEVHFTPVVGNSLWFNPDDCLYCFCQATVRKFQAWLEQKYGTIDALNGAWVRRYTCWEEIIPPQIHATYPDWLDYLNFIRKDVTELTAWRAGIVRELAPNKLLLLHACSMPPVDPGALFGTNSRDVAKHVDVWGGSLFPLWFSMCSVSTFAAKLDILRSDADGIPFWAAELQGGPGQVTGLKRGPMVEPKHIRLWNWLAIAAGAKGIVYWQYRAEMAGLEAGGAGLVRRSGETTPRAEEAAKTFEIIQKHEKLIETYTPKPEVAILYDQDNAILTFAMDADERVSLESHRGYYEAIWRLDTLADFVMPHDIPSLQHKVLIVPWHPIECRQSFAAIDAFARKGGVVIVENALGLIDPNGIINSTIPSGSLAESWGIEEEEGLYVNNSDEPTGATGFLPGFSVSYLGAYRMPTEGIYNGAYIEFNSPIPARVRARTFVTPLGLSGSAEPVAVCEGHIVGGRVRIGAGTVYYFGTNIGQSIYYGDIEAIKLIFAIIDPLLSPRVRGERLRPRLIEDDREALLVVVNESRERVEETIKVPRRYERARNVYSADESSIRKGLIALSLGPVDTAVFHLSK